MHLGNGAITPECVAITISAASAGLGLCAWSVRREATNVSKLGLAAGLGAFVFAAQAVNVPLLPASSAHLLGGVLLAWALGPALGGLTMAVVVLLQAVMVGDGGTLAAGANVVNMALIPAALVAIARRAGWLRCGSLKCGARELAALSALGAAAVVIAAALVVVEVALFRTGSALAGWTTFAQQMLIVHLLVALGEGAATAVIAGGLMWLDARSPAQATLLRPAFLTAAMAALAALATPLSSKLPDGYEYAAQQSGLRSWLD